MQREDKLIREDIALCALNEAIAGDRGAVIAIFLWEDTKEGYTYWHHQYDGITPLDIPRLKEIRAKYFPEYEE